MADYTTDNIKSQMRKGLLEYCTLLCLNKGEAYTSEILSTLQQADLLVVEGTLYPLLSRMKANGLLEYRWQESPSGPPRKYYKITAAGAEALRDLQKEWSAIAASVEKCLSHNA
mgnify:CR=1 FL=1